MKNLSYYLVSLNVLNTCDASDYLEAVEKVSNEKFKDRIEISEALKQFEKDRDVEIVSMYVDFTYCMYSFLISRPNEMNSTLHLQFRAMTDSGFETIFSYFLTTNLVKYSMHNSDFNSIVNRIPVILSISYQLRGVEGYHVVKPRQAN